MNEHDYEKQLLLQKIETNRQLLARDVSSVTGILRPWQRMARLGQEAAPHLRTLGSAMGGLLASRSLSSLPRIVWALPAVVPVALWLLGGRKSPDR